MKTTTPILKIYWQRKDMHKLPPGVKACRAPQLLSSWVWCFQHPLYTGPNGSRGAVLLPHEAVLASREQSAPQDRGAVRPVILSPCRLVTWSLSNLYVCTFFGTERYFSCSAHKEHQVIDHPKVCVWSLFVCLSPGMFLHLFLLSRKTSPPPPHLL